MLNSRVAWFGWTVGLTLVFGRIAAYNLGNYRPVSNDEGELMSVGFKLAKQGVLGSDLFVGFYGADQHYFITLPLQHFLQALSFHVSGAGVAQARWVSLLAGVAIVWVVGWLAYRWYGLLGAIVCDLLLVAWPSNLTQTTSGLPLFDVSRTARYDVLAVACTWFAIALLDTTLRRPRPGLSLALGFCCGLATLSTFTGSFILPLVAVNWCWARRGRVLKDPTTYWIAAGAALVLVPWLAQAVRYSSDVAGQLVVYGATRGDFLRPSFYLQNVVNEASRYHHLAESPSTASGWLLLIGIWPAIGFLIWRQKRVQASGDGLLLSSLATFGGLLLIVDQTKTPLYAIILLPSLCLALAATLTAWPRLVAAAMVLALIVTVGLDGVSAYQLSVAQAVKAGQYLGVGLQIDAALPPAGRVLGPERWWWALHEHQYVSLRSLWFQWSAAATAGGSPEFVDLVTWTQADNLIVNDNVRGDVLDFPEPLQRQFWTFVSTCTTRVTALDDPTYLQIEVYSITRPCGR